MNVTTAIFILLLTLGIAAQPKTPREKQLESTGANKTAALFKEPVVLPTDDQDIEVYRLTVIPTFSGPISLRAEHSGGEYRAIAKQLYGAGGYDIGPVRKSRTRSITLKQWKKLLELLKEADFWDMPYQEPTKAPNADGSTEICLDGAE